MVPGPDEQRRVVERKIVARDNLGEPAELGTSLHGSPIYTGRAVP
jgi:hypothetical protein